MRRINLALQGGGAHGAFSWGVLDRLLQEEDLEIAEISGTSAGALNAAALKAGLAMGDRDTARDNLDWLWAQMGAIDWGGLANWMLSLAPQPSTLSKLVEANPFFAFSDAAARLFSPYAYGPLYQNPLRRVAEKFHYDAVCADTGPALFISATNVRSGKIRVFSGAEIETDVILASACLPTLFQAVEIDDVRTGQREAFWDGGYTGNPALFPMFEPEFPSDIVIVNINPLHRAEVPMTPQDIQNRINEISFNSSLLRELRAIQFVRDLIAKGQVKRGAMKDVLVHMIADDALMTQLSVATKTIPVPALLLQLKQAGRAAAEAFLTDHKEKLNRESSVDLRAMFA